MEKANWPNWLRLMYPSWLENVGLPVAGVGDLGDLKLQIGVGQAGRWVGFVHPGWYYHNNREQYNYVQVGTITVTGAVGSGTVTESISFRPSWGPILIQGIADDINEIDDWPYREHHNSLYPAYSFSWTATVSGFYYSTVPTGCLLVGVRDLTSLPLGSVTSSGLVISDKLYWYNTSDNRIYIKPKSSTINVWGDLLYFTPRLRMREICLAETSTTVRASYDRIQDIIITRGSQVYNDTGYSSGSLLTHTLTDINPGDWLVLDYFISRSFIMTDHNSISYYVGGPSGGTDSFVVYYERSVPDILPPIVVTQPSSGTIFNVNPLFSNSFRAGYLFHANPASSLSSYWNPAKLRFYIDKLQVCGTWNEVAKATLYLYDENDLPVPYYPVSTLVSGGSALVIIPNTNTTDGKGEIHYLLRSSIGASTLSATAIAGGLSASISATVVTSGTMIDIDTFLSGHINLVISNETNKRGAFRLFANAVNLDGIPRMTTDNDLTIHSELSSEYYDDSNKTYTKQVTVASHQTVENFAAISELGYVPQPGDRIMALGEDEIAQSNIIGSED